VEFEHQHQSVELIPNVLELFVSPKKRHSSELTPPTPKRKIVKAKEPLVNPKKSLKKLCKSMKRKDDN
jgi:hypothetical protein